jgi:hypothetical protein
MYLSISAILGTFLRICMAQLFGEHCANPGTIGWLAASSPLCVTKDGSSSRQGGIVFAVRVFVCYIYYYEYFFWNLTTIVIRIFPPTCWGPSLWE